MIMEIEDDGNLLSDVSSRYEVEELIEDNLWVAIIHEERATFTELAFLTFRSSDDEDTKVDLLFTIEGPSDHLREGRHTRFRDKGYLFYMDKEHMITALEYCSKYFDMN